MTKPTTPTTKDRMLALAMMDLNYRAEWFDGQTDGIQAKPGTGTAQLTKDELNNVCAATSAIPMATDVLTAHAYLIWEGGRTVSRVDVSTYLIDFMGWHDAPGVYSHVVSSQMDLIDMGLVCLDPTNTLKYLLTATGHAVARRLGTTIQDGGGYEVTAPPTTGTKEEPMTKPKTPPKGTPAHGTVDIKVQMKRGLLSPIQRALAWILFQIGTATLWMGIKVIQGGMNMGIRATRRSMRLGGSPEAMVAGLTYKHLSARIRMEERDVPPGGIPAGHMKVTESGPDVQPTPPCATIW